MKQTKAKKTAAKKQANQAVVNNTNAVHLLKENELQNLPPEYRSLLLSERPFKSLKEVEQIVVQNSKKLFGEQTFLIRNEQEHSSKNTTSPAVFLLDLGDMARPVFYMVEIALASIGFFDVLFPRITKFFSFFNNVEDMRSISELIVKDKEIREAVKQIVGKDSIPDFFKSLFESKPDILLVTDNPIPELAQMHEIYTTIWYRVKPIVMQKYVSNGNTIISVSPSFSDLHSKPKVSKKEKVLSKEKEAVTEEDHLKNVSADVREIYGAIKTEVLKVNNQLQFNPQKYYISLRNGRNIAFFHIHKKNIALVVMNPEKDTRKVIKHHEVKKLTEKVQKFWNGASCTVMIENLEHLQEVISLLKKLITA